MCSTQTQAFSLSLSLSSLFLSLLHMYLPKLDVKQGYVCTSPNQSHKSFVQVFFLGHKSSLCSSFFLHKRNGMNGILGCKNNP
jgi:hypothetical protein